MLILDLRFINHLLKNKHCNMLTDFDLINIQFSDGHRSDTYGKLICQSRNRDLWCLTFEVPDIIHVLNPNSNTVWTHVYRLRPNVTYMYDLVFKVELTKEYNTSATKFNKVRVCTTDTPKQYHIITTNTKSKKFMACGYLVNIGDDGIVTTEKFKKLTPPDSDMYAKFTTFGPCVFIYYPPRHSGLEHIIYRGEIITRNSHGKLLCGRDRTMTFRITHQIRNPLDGSPYLFTQGSIYSKDDNLYLHTYSNPCYRDGYAFDQHHMLDTLNYGEYTILNTYIRNIHVEVGRYPEWVTFYHSGKGYFVLEYDYSLDGVSIGYGPDASSQYSNSFYEVHPYNYMRWTNRRVTYHAPDKSISNVRILDVFTDMEIENMSMLSDYIISIEYSYRIPHGLFAHLTCYYHFDRSMMALIPISITLVDSFVNWKPTSKGTNDNQGVIINREHTKPLAMLSPSLDISDADLVDILPSHLVDLVIKYTRHRVPYTMAHELTTIE